MPESAQSRNPHTRSTKARLGWLHEKDVNWPNNGLGDRHRAPKGTIPPAVLERILLARPTVVFASGDGRFSAVSGFPHLLRFADNDSGGNRLIPCLIIKDEQWDLAIWGALTQWIVPWVDGRLTRRQKGRIRKLLKRYPALAAVVRPRPVEKRAEDVVQAAARGPEPAAVPPPPPKRSRRQRPPARKR